MKFTCRPLLALLCFPSLFAADPLNETLQRGLLAEESQRDFKAAAAAYEEVVRAADQQREAVATALFRLAEMQRRLGQANEAAASYRRLVREFGEQTNLTGLAAARLPEKQAAGPGVRLLEAELARANERLVLTSREQADLAGFIQRTRSLATFQEITMELAGSHPTDELKRLRTEWNRAEVALAQMSPDFGAQHPDVVRAKAVLKKLEEQLNLEVTAVLGSLERREVTLKGEVESQRRNVRVLEAKLAQERIDSPASGAGLLGGNELAEGMGRLRADLQELETLIAQREPHTNNSVQSLAALEKAHGADLAKRLGSGYWLDRPPAEMSRLVERRLEAEREAAQLAAKYTAEHPQRKELQERLTKLDEQLQPWRQRAIEELKLGMEASARSLDDLKQGRDALRIRLAEAEQNGASDPGAGGFPEQRRLLVEEIKVAETQLGMLQKKLEAGVATQAEVFQAQRDVLGLKRQLAGLRQPDLVDLSVAAPAQAMPAFKSVGWVSVLGEVNRPGVVQLPSDRKMDLVEAIAASGNFSKQGNRNRIQLRRGTNLFRLKFDEAMTNRVDLQPGDAVEVMEKIF